MDAPLLEWENVTCAFGEKVVFEGFSGTLREGERVRVAAPSGKGKTSFFAMLLGFARPTVGEIRLLGRPLDKVARVDLRKTVGAVLQEPDLGVEGDVRAALMRPFAFRANRASTPTPNRLAEALEKFGLSESLLETRIASVSGGERQRLACVAAWLLPRRILLLDEPFSALDESNARRLAAAFADRTVLYTTHADPVPDFATREVALP